MALYAAAACRYALRYMLRCHACHIADTILALAADITRYMIRRAMFYMPAAATAMLSLFCVRALRAAPCAYYGYALRP